MSRSEGLGVEASRGVMKIFRRAVAVLEMHLELLIFADQGLRKGCD